VAAHKHRHGFLVIGGGFLTESLNKDSMFEVLPDGSRFEVWVELQLPHKYQVNDLFIVDL
jgi:hypothetical protein